MKKYFLRLLKHFFCRFVQYYDGDLYSFVLDNNNIKLVKVDAKANERFSLCLIVSRDLYKENIKNYPVETKSELKKVLKLEQNNDSESVYYIWPEKDGITLVNWWYFTKCPASLIRLPESLLVAKCLAGDEVISLERDRTLFVANKNNAVISSFKSDLIFNTERFIQSAGLPNIYKFKNSEEFKLAECFFSSLARLPISVYFSGIKLPQISLASIFRLLIVPLLLTLTIYFFTTSAIIFYKKSELTQYSQNHTADASEVLDLQSSVNDLFDRHKAFYDVVSARNYMSYLWFVLGDIFTLAEITHIQFKGERFILRGTATKAIDVLELVSKNAIVVDAKFERSVAKRRNSESFALSFSISNNAALILNGDN